MIKRKIIYAGTLLLSALSLQSYAQEQSKTMVMTLEECLRYAKEHSITIEQAKLDVMDSAIDESTAKSALLPTVAGSIGQSFTNTPFGNTSEPMNTYSGSYGVDLSMTLYKGGENRLNIKASKIYTRIAELAVAEIEESMDLSIATIYIEILYATDMIEVAKQSLELSRTNIERGELLRQVGGMNEADFAQLITAEATERYNLVLAQTSLSNKYVQLKQLLEIADDTTLKVDTSDITSNYLVTQTPSVNEVYGAAMESRPEIKASNLYVESAELDERIAKAGYLPTLSLSAGMGINHNSSSNFAFSDQLRNNYDNSVGVSLSIPIFNRFSTRNSVSKARNATRYASLNQIDQSKNLYQTIETLHNNAESASAMYLVSQSKIDALSKSLELVTKQYDLGAKNIIELLTEQDSYRTSQQEYLESKYTFILNRAILDFYKSGIIKL